MAGDGFPTVGSCMGSYLNFSSLGTNIDDKNTWFCQFRDLTRLGDLWRESEVELEACTSVSKS